jgi:hypothetical protein
VRAELFHEQEGQTDMINPVAFRNSAEAPTELVPVPLLPPPPQQKSHMVRPGMEQQPPKRKLKRRLEK